MRLGLYFFGHPKDLGYVWYHVGIRENDGNIRKPNHFEARQMQQHVNKVRKIAIDVLGDRFYQANFEPKTGEIELCFEKGISKGSARFDFKVFCGWVELSLM